MNTVTNRVRGEPFSKIASIADHDSRFPSERYPPPFDEQEYADRLTRCRRAMSTMGIDLLWTGWPDALLYLHGYEVTWYRPNRVPRTGTALHVDHDKQILLGGEDTVFSAAVDRRPLDGGTEHDFANAIAAVLKDEGWLKTGTVVGLELRRYLPTPMMARALEAAFAEAGARVVDGTDVIGRVRAIKSPAEIGAFEHAACIADIGIRAVANAVRPGVTSAELYAAAYSAMAAVGGEVAAIPQAVQPGRPRTTHLLPGRRQIRAGEPFGFDLCGVFKRYHANLDRTFIYGDPDEELVRVHKAAMGALDVLRDTAKAGVTVAAVNRALRQYYQEMDVWKYHIEPLGYELGAALPPDWCGDFWFYVSNEEADERVFETNMVTNYENRFRRDDAAAPSDLVVHTRDTVIYGPTGARILSAIPCDLIVVG
jgi:Xaa-Pro dipeptidase